MHKRDPIDRLPQLSHTSIRDSVYAVLREKILSKQFAPGQRLNLREIEEQLGISRTPLKDALNRLATEGLVAIKSRSGTYVTAPSLRDIEELLDVRRVLETRAAELAVRRVDGSHVEQLAHIVTELGKLVGNKDWSQIYQRHVELDHELHRMIVEWSGNEQLRRFWEQANVHVQIARMRFRKTSSQLDFAQREHEAILSAFEARDVEALKQVIDRHIERTQDLLRKDFTTDRDEP